MWRCGAARRWKFPRRFLLAAECTKAMTSDVQLLIEGTQKVIKVFGAWPSFHDAEVMNVKLDRGANVPTLETRIYIFSMIRSTLNPTHFEFANQNVVTLIFERIILLKLEDFNHQNSIDGLEIVASSTGRRRLEVFMDGSNGCDIHLECDSIRVTSIAPWQPSAR